MDFPHADGFTGQYSYKDKGTGEVRTTWTPYAKQADRLDLEAALRFDKTALCVADGYVVVDVDNHNDDPRNVDAIMNLRHLFKTPMQRTTSGLHLVFKNTDGEWKKNDTNVFTRYGVPVDVRVKGGIEIIAKGGEFREWENADCEPLPLPDGFKPLGKSLSYSFAHLGEGDGRNETLFPYIQTLQATGMGVDAIRDVIRDVNEYILSEPLPESEIETILRDDAFKKEAFFVKGKFQHAQFGSYLINEHHIKKINGQLHIYDPKRGIYRPGDIEIERAMIREIESLTNAQRQEVIRWIFASMEEIETADEDFSEWVAFNNGLLNVFTLEMIDFDPEIIILNRIPWDYVADAECEAVDAVLDRMSCRDADVRAIMEEVVGYCLYRRNELGKAFILEGEGSNGKSTFLFMIRNLLGDRNVASLEVSELGDRFSTAMLYGRLANIGDDISDDFISGRQVSIFKKIVTGDTVKAEEKGKAPFTFAPYNKLLFSANTVPRFKDRSNGVARRLEIIPFSATFSKQDPDHDPFIKYKLKQPEAASRLIVLAVAGLRRVLENEAFTRGEAVQKKHEAFKVENDSVLAWSGEIEKDEILNERVTDVYKRYSTWCVENGLHPLSANWFSRKICTQFGVESKQIRSGRERFRVFM